MTEDNNIFGEFGTRSAKFDELLKKYQTIDENGEVVTGNRKNLSTQDVNTDKEVAAEPVAQPIADVGSDYTEAEEDNADESFGFFADNLIDFFNDESVDLYEPEPTAEPAVAVAENDEEETFGFFNNAEPVASPEPQPTVEPKVSGGFVFDAQARYADDNDAYEQSEPDYSYDINTFGKSKYGGALNIDSFDDSWLDTALDDSLFYKAKNVVDTYQVHTSDPEPAKSDRFTRAKSGRGEYEFSSEYEDFDVMPQSNIGTAEKGQMTGGYVAPSSFSDFEFDPDSGMAFDDDGSQNEPESSTKGSFVSKLKKKLLKKDL